MDLKWFESKVGNKYLNEAAGLAAEEAHCKDSRKKDLVRHDHTHTHILQIQILQMHL